MHDHLHVISFFHPKDNAWPMLNSSTNSTVLWLVRKRFLEQPTHTHTQKKNLNSIAYVAFITSPPPASMRLTKAVRLLMCSSTLKPANGPVVFTSVGFPSGAIRLRHRCADRPNTTLSTSSCARGLPHSYSSSCAANHVFIEL